MTKWNRVIVDTLVSRQMQLYFGCLLAGFVVVTFGGQLLGEWVRSLGARPMLDEAARVAVASRSIITLSAYGLLAIYGLLAAGALSSSLSQRGQRLIYKTGLALLAIVTVYLLIAYITTISSM